MKSNNRAFIIFIVLILLTTLACNISIEGAAPEGANLELTVTAQALLLQQPAQNSAPAVIAENPTATFTLAAEATPTTGGSGVVAAASTSSTVTVTVSVETNCRTGPSVNFGSVYSLPAGQVAEVVGKNTLTNYWIIKIPGSGSGSTCWLWGKYATANGNTSGLAEIVTPTPQASTKTSTATLISPTKTLTITSTVAAPLGKPAAPSNLVFTQKDCINQGNGTYMYAGTFVWNDNSNNETGFTAYLNTPTMIFPLPANTTSLFINPILPEANAVIVRVEAFNGAGVSNSIQLTITCP